MSLEDMKAKVAKKFTELESEIEKISDPLCKISTVNTVESQRNLFEITNLTVDEKIKSIVNKKENLELLMTLESSNKESITQVINKCDETLSTFIESMETVYNLIASNLDEIIKLIDEAPDSIKA